MCINSAVGLESKQWRFVYEFEANESRGVSCVIEIRTASLLEKSGGHRGKRGPSPILHLKRFIDNLRVT